MHIYIYIFILIYIIYIYIYYIYTGLQSCDTTWKKSVVSNINNFLHREAQDCLYLWDQPKEYNLCNIVYIYIYKYIDIHTVPLQAYIHIDMQYPLVNIQKTMENHHAINGKTHYFYGHVQ